MPNTGAAPITDWTLPASQIRLLIGDTDASNISAGSGTYAFFSDAELTALASMFPQPSSTLRAGAQALRIIAASQVLLLKVFTADDLATEGDKISEALRKDAADLDKQAIAYDDLINGDYFDYNNIPTPFPFYEGGLTPVIPYTFYERYLPSQRGVGGFV